MTHDHASHQMTYGKAFAIGISLNLVYIIVEVVYGLMVDSTALLADAGHNASDVLSLVFAWFAMSVASRRPSKKYTFGLRKSTILVSILNALMLFGAAAMIGWEAWKRLYEPTDVAGQTVMIVAGVGIVINTATALLFIKGQKKDLNIKGAFLHMAADAAVSAGVVISGFLIYLTGAMWIDPVTSFLILIVIVYSTWSLFSDSINLALDAVPDDIDVAEVEDYFDEKPEIASWHDLHIWAMSTTETALSVHLVVNKDAEKESDALLKNIKQELDERFGIDYSTIQLEVTKMDDSLH